MEFSSFFINIDATDFTDHLMVPEDFLRHFKGKQHLQFVLRTAGSSSRREWTIAATRVEKTLFFQQCWSNFAQHHSLEVGDSLRLKYKGRSLFRCSIYDRNGEKKEPANLLDNNNGESVVLDNQSSHESKENGKSDHVEEGSREAQKRRDSASFAKYYESRLGEQPNSMHERGEGSRPRQRGTITRTSNEENPHFEVTIHPYCLVQSSLHIPNKFARSIADYYKEFVFLKDEEGNKYSVKLIRCSDGSLNFGNGWLAFSSDKGLKKGDTCLFELEDKVSMEIKVTIFQRGTGDEESPHFKVTMKSVNIIQSFLYVPKEFVRSSIPDDKESVLLRDEEGKIYHVKLRRLRQGQLAFELVGAHSRPTRG